MNPTTLAAVEKLADDIRLASLEMIAQARSSHVGAVFSSADVLAALYGRILNVRPDEPEWPDRDRFILSKGHACAGLYAALAYRGFFPIERLREFYVDGGSLAGHVTHKGVPGVEVSTGSLGHGLAMAVGLALGALLRGASWRVFVMISDGECDEGSTWEAALLAPRLGLSNLTVVVDYNKIQSLGRVEDVVPLEPFADKWRSFRWSVTEVDGHDLAALLQVLPAPPDAAGPRCILAHTVKGKGVSFMEDDLLWHYRSPQGDELTAARRELNGSGPGEKP